MDDSIRRQAADVPDTNVGDTIYRQAAIDALCVSCNMESDYRKCTGYAEDSTWCEEVTALRTLPSAQPEQIQDILDYLDTVLHPIVSPEHWNVYSELYDMISMLSSTQPKQQWIPCSERLPEEDDYKPFSYYEDGAVLFCTKNGKVGFGWYYESTKEWANEDDHTPGEVIAWMPLPEPYQERREE